MKLRKKNYRIDLSVDFVDAIEKTDMRDADVFTARPYLKHIVLSLYGEYKMTDKLTTYMNSTLVIRDQDLGAQYQTMGGLKYNYDQKTDAFFSTNVASD